MAGPNRLQHVHPIQVPRFPHGRPVTIDYNRTLPPLADQPFLELRRPSLKDVCFTTSALSPHGLKRDGADWETSSEGSCLLDRYLSQEGVSPLPAHDILPSPCTPMLFSDVSNVFLHPSMCKNAWAYRTAQQVSLCSPL